MRSSDPCPIDTPRTVFRTTNTGLPDRRKSDSVEKTRHHIDDESNDDRTEQEREESVREGNPPDPLVRQIRVGHLERHANGKGQVGEVQIGGRIVLVEVDATLWPG